MEERASMRIQKMFEINSKIGDCILQIVSALHLPPSKGTDEKIASLLSEISMLLNTFLFKLGTIGTEEQFKIFLKAKDELKNAVTTKGAKATVRLDDLRDCLLELQSEIMADARSLLTMESKTKAEETVKNLLNKIYGLSKKGT